MNALARWPDTF